MYSPTLTLMSILATLAVAQLPSSQQIDCQGGAVSPSDLSNAQNQLHDWCASNQINGGSHVQFQSGNTVAYACSYGGTNPCSTAEIDAAFNAIGANCGFPAQGGDDFIPDWQKTYGYQAAGRSICANGAGNCQNC